MLHRISFLRVTRAGDMPGGGAAGAVDYRIIGGMAGRFLKRKLSLVFAGTWLVMVPWIEARDGEPDPLAGRGEPDPLAGRGYAVTSGAAPGYVDDRVCGSCHTDLSGDRAEVEALGELRRAVELHPELPQLRLQLGRLLIGLGRPADAVPHLRKAVDVRPNMVKAHLYLGAALAALDRHADAAASYRRVLEIEPSHTDAYLALAETLRAAGDRRSALRMLSHGVEVADRPEPIRQALAALTSEPEGP